MKTENLLPQLKTSTPSNTAVWLLTSGLEHIECRKFFSILAKFTVAIFMVELGAEQ
jgi:hypothetical protein